MPKVSKYPDLYLALILITLLIIVGYFLSRASTGQDSGFGKTPNAATDLVICYFPENKSSGRPVIMFRMGSTVQILDIKSIIGMLWYDSGHPDYKEGDEVLLRNSFLVAGQHRAHELSWEVWLEATRQYEKDLANDTVPTFVEVIDEWEEKYGDKINAQTQGK